MHQRSTLGSIPSAGRASAYQDLANPVDEPFNPYEEFPLSAQGYVASADTPRGHNHSHSAGSYEPLLASFYQNEALSQSPPTPPPRNPKRLTDRTQQSSAHTLVQQPSSSEGTDDRLDPNIRERQAGSELHDEEDYSRPVLGVMSFNIFLFPYSSYSRSETFLTMSAWLPRSLDFGALFSLLVLDNTRARTLRPTGLRTCILI